MQHADQGGTPRDACEPPRTADDAAPVGQAPGRVFLLSPALLSGARGRALLSGGSASSLGLELIDGGAVALCDVYASISSLYFRGKLEYARRFVTRSGSDAGVWLITPNRGLLVADTPVTRADLRALATTPIHEADPSYRDALISSAHAIARALPPRADVVLLGSLATRKYVEPLSEVFGPRLSAPREFVGLGDMQRGSLLIRAVAEGRELEYVRVAEL